MVEHFFCVGLKISLAHMSKTHVSKSCSILLLCYCWSITNNNASCLLVFRSPLRIIIEPLVTLIPPSAPENLYLRASKAPNERRFFFKSGTCRTFVRVQTCPSNILIQMLLMLTVLHDVVSHQDRASIIRLVSTEPLPFGHMWYVHPELSNQASEYLSSPDSTVKTSHEYSSASSTTPTLSDFPLVLGRSESIAFPL